MTEVTRVPLQPIAKGSLTKLWLGVALAVLLGAALAYAAMPKGLSVDTLIAGEGDAPQLGDVVFVKYTGKLDDGTIFDEAKSSPFPGGVLPDGVPMLLEEGRLIPGFITALLQTREGGSYRLNIPAEDAYGAEPEPGSPIPPNADLTFEVEIVDIMSRAEVEQRLMALGAMGGSPPPGTEGPPPGAPTGPPPGE